MKSLKLISHSRGFALPAALMMILAIAGVTAMLSTLSQENFKQTKVQEGTVMTNLIAEGAVNKILSDMGLYSALWDQQAPLATKPASYTQYFPADYSATNGVPTCSTGVSCHRNLYPLGGGLIKNFGPLTGDGLQVNSAYVISDQLDYDDPPDPDLTLGTSEGWVQIERLDEEFPNANTVGGNLSSGLSEGGNAKRIRFRISGTSTKSLNERMGVTTIVTVILLPVT